MTDNAKKKRQALLRKIITEKQIADQDRLLRELKKHRLAATQATISRDLQELGVVKVRVKPGVFKYDLTETPPPALLSDKLKVLFENFVVDIKGVNNQLLIKTSPGNANGVADLIDHLKRPAILGTIAGDNTILVVLKTVKNRKALQKEFNALL